MTESADLDACAREDIEKLKAVVEKVIAEHPSASMREVALIASSRAAKLTADEILGDMTEIQKKIIDAAHAPKLIMTLAEEQLWIAEFLRTRSIEDAWQFIRELRMKVLASADEEERWAAQQIVGPP